MQDSKQETLALLVELESHPGWPIFQTLHSKQEQARQQVKARFLRTGTPESLSKAAFTQGKIDGVEELFSELVKFKKQLKDGPQDSAENPKY